MPPVRGGGGAQGAVTPLTPLSYRGWPHPLVSFVLPAVALGDRDNMLNHPTKYLVHERREGSNGCGEDVAFRLSKLWVQPSGGNDAFDPVLSWLVGPLTSGSGWTVSLMRV